MATIYWAYNVRRPEDKDMVTGVPEIIMREGPRTVADSYFSTFLAPTRSLPAHLIGHIQ